MGNRKSRWVGHCVRADKVCFPRALSFLARIVSFLGPERIKSRSVASLLWAVDFPLRRDDRVDRDRVGSPNRLPH
jgi:hypothetical protein